MMIMVAKCLLLFFLSHFLCGVLVDAAVNLTQIHLSLSGDDSIMGLEYVSVDSNIYSIVQYKELEKPLLEKSTSIAKLMYRENIGYLYRAALEGLHPSKKYHYRMGDGVEQWSQWYSFVSPPFSRPDFVQRGEDKHQYASDSTPEGVGAVFADLGLYNGVSTGRLTAEAMKGTYDYLVHIGDIAYDLFGDDSSVGNEYMELMAPVTSKYPINVAEGNHESDDNFTEYNLRFKSIEDLAGRRSGSGSNHYYSFDVGLIHYVVVSSEVYSYPMEARQGPSKFTAADQLDWLRGDLEKSNTQEQRSKTPWIVLLAHRPWYTLLDGFAQFDELACEYGVDLYITGHVHNYQRWAPMHISYVGERKDADHTLRVANPIPSAVDTDCVSEDRHKYTNPKFMPVIVAGSTGCHSPQPRSACAAMYAGSKVFLKDTLMDCTAAYGFGHLQAVNETHLYWEFVQSHRAPSVDQDVMAETVNKSAREDILSAYSDVLLEKGVSGDEFMRLVEEESMQWVKNELVRDESVLLQADRDLHGDSRLVRDYLWIVQENHGKRDYC